MHATFAWFTNFLGMNAESLVATSLKAIISIGIGFILAKLGLYLTNVMPSRVAWGFKNPERAHFFLAQSADVDTGKYTRPASGIGQIRALGVLVPSFMSAYKLFDGNNVLLSKKADARLFECDCVIIGGPKNNEVTKLFLDELRRSPYTMEINDIIDTRSQKRITGKTEGHEIVEDFGVVIKAINPFNSNSTCLIFMGAHTYGTHAGARYFVENLTSYRYALRRNFAVLVHTKVRDGHGGQPTLVDFATFTREPRTGLIFARPRPVH